MLLLSLNEIDLNNDYRQFKQSTIAQLAFLLIILGLMILTGWLITKDRLTIFEYFFIPVFSLIWLFLSIIIFNSFRKSLAKTNWVLAIGLSSVYIKFRSYLNCDLPENDKQIASFPCSEIASINITKQRIISYGSGNSTRTSFHTFLDINFARTDLTPLKMQIKEERQKRIKTKHGSLKRNHYPVSVVDQDTLRIEWRSPTDMVVPGIKKVISEFQKYNVEIGPIVKEVIDTTGQNKQEKSKAEDNILKLAERGNIIAATKLTRKTYKMNLKDARDFVESLLK